MAKGTKAKTTDPRLVALVGSFLKDAGLPSSVKVYELETEKKSLKSSKAAAGPTSLAEALKAWDKAAAKTEEEEDSGNESDNESSDSGEETPDSSEDEVEDEEVKSESSGTVSGDDKKDVKAKKGKMKKDAKKEESDDRWATSFVCVSLGRGC